MSFHHVTSKMRFVQIFDRKLVRHFLCRRTHFCPADKATGSRGETFSSCKWTQTAKLFPVGHRIIRLSR